MVGKWLRIAVIAIAMLTGTVAVGQNYSVGDTVTEYPNKGTYYHDRFEGRKTSSGEVFDQNKFTAAHWKIKLGTMVMVTNRNNGRQVIVKVNDRCPKRGVFDLSHRAALAIGILGCQPVNVRILPDGYEERWAAQETMFDSVRSRLHPGAPPAPTVKQVVAKKEPPTQQPPVPEVKPGKSGCSNLWLGVAENHAEAYEMIGKLPEAYSDKVKVETMDDGKLELIVELMLPVASLRELALALRHTFPDCRVKECE